MTEVRIRSQECATHDAIKRKPFYSLGGFDKTSMIALPNAKVLNVTLSTEDALECPQCGHNRIHHSTVMSWHRLDDADSGTFVLSNPSETCSFSDFSMEDCPSQRRSAVAILFNCESCKSTSMLRIMQHQGMSCINWEILEEDENTPGS
jgi:hypothetical protein